MLIEPQRKLSPFVLLTYTFSLRKHICLSPRALRMESDHFAFDALSPPRLHSIRPPETYQTCPASGCKRIHILFLTPLCMSLAIPRTIWRSCTGGQYDKGVGYSIERSALCYSFSVGANRMHSQKMFAAMRAECLCLTTSYSVCGRKFGRSTM